MSRGFLFNNGKRTWRFVLPLITQNIRQPNFTVLFMSKVQTIVCAFTFIVLLSIHTFVFVFYFSNNGRQLFFFFIKEETKGHKRILGVGENEEEVLKIKEKSQT